MEAFCKVGHTAISVCSPVPGRNQYYVSAIGGRMFGSAYFKERTNAYAFYNKLISKAKEVM